MHCRLDHSKHGLNKKICAKALCLSASAPGPSEAGAQRARQAPKERGRRPKSAQTLQPIGPGALYIASAKSLARGRLAKASCDYCKIRQSGPH